MTDIPNIAGVTVTRPKRRNWTSFMNIEENVRPENAKATFIGLKAGMEGMLADAEKHLLETPAGIARNIIIRIDYVLGNVKEPAETVSWIPTKGE